MTESVRSRDVDTPARIAWVIALRAVIIGAGLWFVIPPTSAENLLRAVGGTYPLITIWWYANGPGPTRRCVPSMAFGAIQLTVALLFARVIEVVLRLIA